MIVWVLAFIGLITVIIITIKLLSKIFINLNKALNKSTGKQQEEQKNYNEYYQSTYYLATKNQYGHVLHDVGKQGEYKIFKELCTLERDGARFLFNCYLPKNENETTEIDVILLTTSGIFVFESKNYSGWIFGSEHQEFWTQTLQTRKKIHKTQFYNPIIQNKTHIKYLKKFVQDSIPIYSVIVFSNRCALKNINISSPETAVINLNNISYMVRNFIARTENSLSIECLISIYDKLYPYTQVSEDVKRKHVENLNKV